MSFSVLIVTKAIQLQITVWPISIHDNPALQIRKEHFVLLDFSCRKLFAPSH